MAGELNENGIEFYFRAENSHQFDVVTIVRLKVKEEVEKKQQQHRRPY